MPLMELRYLLLDRLNRLVSLLRNLSNLSVTLTSVGLQMREFFILLFYWVLINRRWKASVLFGASIMRWVISRIMQFADVSKDHNARKNCKSKLLDDIPCNNEKGGNGFYAENTELSFESVSNKIRLFFNMYTEKKL